MTSAVEVVDAIESRVNAACVGPACAFFEIGTNRYVYDTVLYHADTEDEALDAVRHVITHMIAKARTQHGLVCEGVNVMLFWRNPQKVDVGRGPDGYTARARLVLVT